jgi:pyruvate dehydrogenase E2 component (dihydrolipoamide acetyltransferase)
MTRLFRFPDVGEGITEGEIVRWLVAEGDDVRADQPLAEIETDKAVVEMPSPFAGTVLKLHHREKDLIKVGDVLVTIGARGESPDAVDGAPVAAPRGQAAGAPPPAPIPAGAAAVLATPKIRKLAADWGVDLARLRGSGPQGRITEDDLRRAQSESEPQMAQPSVPQAVKVKAKYDFYGELERVPLRGLRRSTAKHMALSISTAAHVTHFDEADAAALIRVKDALAKSIVPPGVKVTFLPLIVKAVVAALKRHPFLNAVLEDADEEIVLRKYYNIGIAVDVPDGLIVPVVKFADQKTVLEIAADIAALASSARARTLDLADLKGGTFSITNVGMLGGEAATPIINYPEVAILATMRIAERVRAVGGVPAVRTILPLCLSFDHRVIDGAEAARFMNDLKGILEGETRLKAALEP